MTSKVGPYNSEFKADFRVAQVIHIPQRHLVVFEVMLLTGIPCNWGLSRRLCSSFREASILSRSAASTM